MQTHSRTIARAVFALALTLSFGLAARAQQRPLITEDVDVLQPGALRIQAGIDFMQNAQFPASGLTGDLTRIGVIGFHVGLSPNVEFSVEGVAQNFLSINTRGAGAIALGIAPGANSTNDTGDFRLSTKVKVRNETRRGPSLGFKFGVELPNSNETRGIGVNQTNAFGMILVGKKFGRDGRINTFGNLGLGIYTAPTQAFTQNDMLLYGLAGIFRVNKSVNIAAEVNGRANTRGAAAPLGTESLSEFRMGVQVKAAGIRFDA
ncbi:MAG TPA: hypothetical protein VEX60_05755, partial [Pyrinomonadaceae bacterium]|nr:hypothetical protein [Pyrinomonadaceae bacterium]